VGYEAHLVRLVNAFHVWGAQRETRAVRCKSSALRELSARHDDLALFDFDDLRPPPDAGKSWWRRQLEAHDAMAGAEQIRGRDTVLAGG
jgi:hypothetical protein